MPFSEKIKQQVREKAHFKCCRCHDIGVEVHHIIPRKHGGKDDIDNAAPLCPKCHKQFGDSPSQRKDIIRMRNWWYSQCEKTLPDPSFAVYDAVKTNLKDIQKGLSDVQSDIKDIKGILEGLSFYPSVKHLPIPQPATSSSAQFLLNLETDLDTLREDLKHAMDGWTFHYTIDFSELFAFAFPLSERRHIVRLPWELVEETFVREQATLALMFARWQDKVLNPVTHFALLPPYLLELRTHMALIKRKEIHVNALLNVLRNVHARAFSKESFKDSGVQSIVERFYRGIPLTAEERSTIASYLVQEYSDLLACAVTPSYVRGFDVLRNSLLGKVVLPASEYMRMYFQGREYESLRLDEVLDDASVNRNLQRWLPMISSYSYRRKGSIVANRNDAAACAILEGLNDRLAASKNLWFLISRSSTMRAVIPPIYAAYGYLPVVRNLNYLYLYFSLKSEAREEREYNLIETMHRVEEMLFLVRSLQQVSSLPIRRISEKRLMQLLRTGFNRMYNAFLATKTDEDLLGLLGQTGYKEPEFHANIESVNALLRMVMQREVAEELKAHLARVRSDLEDVYSSSIRGL